MTAIDKKVKIEFFYERDEDGYYLNARFETPKGTRTIYDTTTEEAITECLLSIGVELETSYDFGDEEEDYYA